MREIGNANSREAHEQHQIIGLREKLKRKRRLEQMPAEQLAGLYHTHQITADVLLKYTIYKSSPSEQPVVDIASHMEAQEEIDTLVLAYIRLYDQPLSESDKGVVTNYIENTPAEDLEKKYDISQQKISIILSQYRAHLETYLLYPLGLQRISLDLVGSQKTDPKIVKAAQDGTLPSFKILRKRYASPRQLDEYYERRTIIDTQLLSTGYVLVHDEISEREYDALKGSKLWEQVLRKNNLLYIHQDDLQRFYSEYRPRPQTTTNPERQIYSKGERQRYFNRLTTKKEQQ